MLSGIGIKRCCASKVRTTLSSSERQSSSTVNARAGRGDCPPSPLAILTALVAVANAAAAATVELSCTLPERPFTLMISDAPQLRFWINQQPVSGLVGVTEYDLFFDLPNADPLAVVHLDRSDGSLMVMRLNGATTHGQCRVVSGRLSDLTRDYWNLNGLPLPH